MNKEKNIFMFWDTGISNASLLCQLNVLNFSEDAKIILPFHDDIENY